MSTTYYPLPHWIRTIREEKTETSQAVNLYRLVLNENYSPFSELRKSHFPFTDGSPILGPFTQTELADTLYSLARTEAQFNRFCGQAITVGGLEHPCLVLHAYRRGDDDKDVLGFNMWLVSENGKLKHLHELYEECEQEVRSPFSNVFGERTMTEREMNDNAFIMHDIGRFREDISIIDKMLMCGERNKITLRMCPDVCSDTIMHFINRAMPKNKYRFEVYDPILVKKELNVPIDDVVRDSRYAPIAIYDRDPIIVTKLHMANESHVIWSRDNYKNFPGRELHTPMKVYEMFGIEVLLDAFIRGYAQATEFKLVKQQERVNPMRDLIKVDPGVG